MARYTVPFWTGTRSVMVTYESDEPTVGQDWTPPEYGTATPREWGTIALGAVLAVGAVLVLHMPQRPKIYR